MTLRCCDLLCSGVDPILSRHVAHLFTRDPLVMFEGSVHVDDTSTTEHFENIQSTNWQTVRRYLTCLKVVLIEVLSYGPAAN